MTLEQFNLYKEYHGDVDMFIRVASNPEKILRNSIMAYAELLKEYQSE